MQKKKIIYLITKGNWGGAQRYVFDLATNLPQGEFEPVVAYGEPGILAEKLREARVRTVFLASLQRDLSFGKELKALVELVRLFKREKPNIIHVNSSKAAGLGILAFRLFQLLNFLTAKSYKLKAIFTVHGWPFNEDRGWLWKILTWILSYLTALLSTDLIIITSRDLLQAKVMPAIAPKTHLIRNGIKTLGFLPREEARQKLGLPQEKLVVGSIGEFTRNKNYRGLVAVGSRLWKEHDFMLAVIGDGEGRAEIIKGMKNDPVLRGHAVFPGFKANADIYLKAYDIFVLPSLKEGLPYVLLEAGAAALPVVATSVGGVPDIIGDGKTGLLVPPRDREGLTEALLTLLLQKETRVAFGRALKEHVEKMFSFDRMLAETLKWYEEKRL